MPFSQDSDHQEKLFPPTDLPGVAEGDWIVISTVYTAAKRQHVNARALIIQVDEKDTIWSFRQALLEEIVVSWSDPSPVSPDSLRSLHPRVSDWIAMEFFRLSDGRTEAEKNALEPASSDGSAPGPAPSRKNSHT